MADKPGTPAAAPAGEATSAAPAPAADAKELTRTGKFQAQLQENMSNILGKKIARDTAWKLFKESIDSAVVFTAEDAEKKLPLSGVGTFQIRMSPPRKPVVRAGEEPKVSKYAALKEIPRFRFKPSERYRKFLLEQLCGFVEPKAEPKAEAAKPAPAKG